MNNEGRKCIYINKRTESDVASIIAACCFGEVRMKKVKKVKKVKKDIRVKNL